MDTIFQWILIFKYFSELSLEQSVMKILTDGTSRLMCWA